MMSSDESADTKSSIIAAALTACVAFCVYLYTLAPTVTGEDGGELAAAAYTLGIPHPTGYPIWTILAHIFTRIIPFGDIAWRVNLMSAFWASATVGLLAYTMQRLSIGRAVSCAAALSFAFSREFWEQSVIAEVYTLNAFFIIACLYLLLQWTRTHSAKTLYALTIIYSLSLANHSTMYLFGPFILLYIFTTYPPIRKDFHVLGACLGLLIIGLLVHLYLPIRSRANPAMDWGNPETMQGFWSVFTRSQYQGTLTSERSIVLFLWQVLEFARYTIWEFTPWVLLLAIPGIRLLYRKKRPVFAMVSGIFTIVFLASIIIPNYPIEHHYIWMNTTFWIPCYLMLSIAIGFGLNALFDRLPNRTWLRADAILITIISPLFTHFDHNNQSDYFYARDYAQNQLDTMAENAIFFGSGDYTVFPLTYLLVVEEQRLDVTLANQYGYISPELYADMPDELRSTFPENPTESDEPRIIEWILANTDRPVYTTTPLVHSDRKKLQRGLLYEYAKEPTISPATDIWSTYTWHESLDHTKTHDDWTAELINYEYRVKRAQFAFKADDAEEAVRLLEEAESLVHHDKQALHNIALTYAKAGRLDEAIRVFKAALHDDPGYVPALFNFAHALLKQARYSEAKQYADILLDQSPDSPRFNRLNEKILQGLATLQDEN